MTDAAIEDDAFALLGPVFAGRSALLLEDDPALAEHVEARLRRAGFSRVDRFDAGEGVLEAAAGHAYDVLILDRLTAGLDGLETLKRVRASSGPSAQAPALMPAGAPGWVSRLMEPRGDIPYGVAIAAGALMAWPSSPLMNLYAAGV